MKVSTIQELEKEVSSLACKVNSATKSYADGTLSHIEILRWLVEYGNRAIDLLRPRNSGAGECMELEQDAYRHLRQYNNHSMLIEFCAKHRVVLPQSEIWWYVRDEVEGHVKGIYTEEGKEVIRGVMRITNGLIAWVEKRDGTLVQVHKEWWKNDSKPSSRVYYCIYCDRVITKSENLEGESVWVSEKGSTQCVKNEVNGVHARKIDEKPAKVKSEREKLLEEMFL